MKAFRISLIISAAFFTLSIFSCSKEEEPGPGSPVDEDVTLLLKKLVTEEYTIELTYNSDNTLNTYLMDRETPTSSWIDEHEYFYHGDTIGFEEVIYYENETLFSTWTYYALDEANYIKNEDGLVTLYSSSIESPCGYMQEEIYIADSLFRVNNFEFTDDSCSYTLTIEGYSDIEKIEYTLDGKKSGFRGHARI